MEQRADKFLVYIEEFDILKELSDEEIGQFFRALIEFVRTGQTPVLDEKLIFAFRFVTAHILRDQKKYREVSEKRSIAGKKGQEVKHLKNTSKEPSQANDENEEKETFHANGEDEEKKLTKADAENEEKEDFPINDEASEKDFLQNNDVFREKSSPAEICEKNIKSEEVFSTEGEMVTSGDTVVKGGKEGFSTLGEILSTCVNKGFSAEGEKALKVEKVEFSTDSEMVTSGDTVVKGGRNDYSAGSKKDVKGGKEGFSADTYGINKKGGEKRERLTKKFDEFWERYPQKKNKKTALKAYFDLNPTEELHLKILEALDEQKRTTEWTREGGRFVPHPAKWITCRRWEDCYKKEKSEGKTENSFSLECSFDVDEFYKAAFEKSQRERKS